MTDPAASPTAGKAPAHPVLEPHDESGAPVHRGPGSGGPADRPAGAVDEDDGTTTDPEGADQTGAAPRSTDDRAD